MMTGNYSLMAFVFFESIIIPYQMMTGNYSGFQIGSGGYIIIPYQMMTGNYSIKATEELLYESYHTK